MPLPPTHTLHTSSTLEELFEYSAAPSSSPTLLARHIRQRFDALCEALPSPDSGTSLELLTSYRDQALQALEEGTLGDGLVLVAPSFLKVDDVIEVDARRVCIQHIDTAWAGPLMRGDGELMSTGSAVHIAWATSAKQAALIGRASQALTRLFGDDAPQHKHLPRKIASGHLESSGQPVLILDALTQPTLQEVMVAHPTLCDPEHMIWILRRALSVLGWAHKNGVVHGNVSPDTLRLRASDHNVWLHDWEYSSVDPALSGQGFVHTHPDFSPPEVHQRLSPLPSSDLYALGRTMQWLLRGGKPEGELPQQTPEELVRLLRFMTLQSPTGRARDAWELYHEVERIRRHLYGAHRFKTLD